MERNPLRHLILHGEYELTIDDKNRFLIPAEIRKRMDPERDGGAFFLVIGPDRKPWMYTERYYEQMVSELPAQMSPGLDRLAYDRRVFGTAAFLEPDKQGRVLLPEMMRKRTALDREVTMVGVRDHLEIWNRPEWEAERERLFAGQG
jgi:MraZ protein